MTNTVINTPEAKKRINGAFSEISNSLTRIEAEKDLIKTIVADFSDEFQIPKKMFAKMAKTYHADSFKTEVEEKTEFEITYETITGQRADDEDYGQDE